MDKLEIGQATDVGRARDHNEDYVQCDRVDGTSVLCVVADGMGGHAAGEVASQLATETTFAVFTSSTGPPVTRIKTAIEAANRAVWERARSDRRLHGMGTTLTSALLSGSLLTLGHVGDSRAYLLRAGDLIQLTQDHSWVAEEMRAGRLTPEQARRHPYRSVLTRALGTGPQVEVDTRTASVQPDDILILCSDGLPTVVADDELRDIVLRTTPQEAAKCLVNLANSRGGPDNITVVVIRIVDHGDTEATLPG